jgi:ABC-type bacteriocin/lantibiotic exporter with double-glycine peptidase domain
MARNALLIDCTIAAILTILVVVLAPGLAVVGLAAILVVLVCAISFALDRRSRSRRRSRKPVTRARSRPPTQSRRG